MFIDVKDNSKKDWDISKLAQKLNNNVLSINKELDSDTFDGDYQV